MAIQARINTSDNRVLRIFTKSPHSVVTPEAGQAIVDITNFANKEDVPNAHKDYTVVGTDLVFSPIAPTVEQRTHAKREVDRIAEDARLRYITGGAGQATTYVYKAMECQKYKDAGYPAMGSPSEYPWIQAEMAATGGTAVQVADGILALAAAWETVGTSIETIRRTGKIAIDAATSVTDLETARDTAVATLNAV